MTLLSKTVLSLGNLLGFKDGIVNPDVASGREMDRLASLTAGKMFGRLPLLGEETIRQPSDLWRSRRLCADLALLR